jgi:hypothetical protein
MLDNKNIQKIFSLGDIRKKQLLNEVPERTRETYREYGYFGGTLYASRLDRIDYSNDTSTASFRKTIRAYGGATGNTNFGYFGGGYGGVSAVDRVNYSNDTAVEGLRGPLSLARWRFSATGNSNFGYFFGGAKSNVSNIVSTVDRINYSNDLATASVRGPLSLPKGFAGSSGNSNFGYYYGGSNPGVPAGYTNIERINYSNDTTKLSVRGLLVSGSGGNSATGNNNFGYIITYTSTRVHRLDYSNDLSTTVHRAITNYTFAGRGAAGNSNFGYFGGGYNPYSVVERLDYSNDNTRTSLRGPLSYSRIVMGATSSHSFGGSPNSSFASNFTFPTVPNAGYFGGGSDGTNNLATIDKVDYANDTSTASVRSALSSARYSLAATGNGNFGYFAGGRPVPGAPDTSTIDRIEYSSDTQNAVVRSTLNNAVRLLSSAGNSNFGYFSGGFPTINGVDRLDYSTDTTATSPRQGLPLATYSLAATGNKNFGYFCGGLTASPTTNRSEIYRVDYSNDLTIPQNRGPLSEAKSEGTATGNDNFGYFSGARNSGLSPSVRSQIERIDYSNDTVIASVRSRLNTPIFTTRATGNSNFGYFGAGTNGPVNFSVVDRINYSNDTAVASIRGPLSTAKSSLAATSPLAYGGAPIYFTNPLPEVLQKQIIFNDANTLDLPFKRALGSYGYFGGGYRGGPVYQSTIERIDISNDVNTLLFRGFMTSGGGWTTSTGNSNYGYSKNGYGEVPIDRIDYSNDFSNTLRRGSLARVRVRPGASTNQNYSWWSGGFSEYTAVDRLDYSNDNTAALARGSLNRGSAFACSIGTNDYGYVNVGGTDIQRINYSNDSVNTSYRTSLPIPTAYSGTAIGNLNFGYFAGSYSSTSFNRIDYSNDLSTASLRGLSSNPTFGAGAFSNSNFGYYAGGAGNDNHVTRFNFSNDLSTASRVNSLNIGRSHSGGLTNARSS